MKKEEFYAALQEIMETEDQPLDSGTNLKDMEEFDSLAVMSLIALIDKEFSTQLSEDQFKAVTTVQSLMDAIGSEKFQ